MKILGICGSPIKNGNTAYFLEKAMDKVKNTDVEIDLVQLARKKISDCIHCDWCLKNKESSQICSQKGDAEEILHKIKACDVLVLATPVYFGRMSGHLASIMDRTRPFLFSKPHRGCMADKPGVALSVGWGRNFGNETALLSIIWGFMILDMIPVSHHHSGALYGAAGVSNPSVVGGSKDDKLTVRHDKSALSAARNVVKRAVSLARRLHSAT
jgi:multimeric flavodoxin WrbA